MKWKWQVQHKVLPSCPPTFTFSCKKKGRILRHQDQMKSSSVTCTAVAVTKPRMTELLADLRVTQLVAEPSCQLLKLHLLPLLTSGSSMVYTGSRLVKPHRIFILFLLDLQKFHIPKNKNPPVILAGANVCSAPENVYFQGRQSVSNCIQTKP